MAIQRLSFRRPPDREKTREVRLGGNADRHEGTRAALPQGNLPTRLPTGLAEDSLRENTRRRDAERANTGIFRGESHLIWRGNNEIVRGGRSHVGFWKDNSPGAEGLNISCRKRVENGDYC